jgi:large subunit ribosomal protein L9
MKIILLKDVPKLGKKFDVKDVSSGHALNLLIPQGLAVSATPEQMKRVLVDKERLDAERKIHEDLLIKNIKDLEGTTLTICSKANDKGHLFAGIHREELVAELKKQTELQIDPSFIQLEHPIKEVGEYSIEVMSPVPIDTQSGKGGKSAKFKVVITAV